MIKQQLINKANYLKVGLVAFLVFCFSTNAYADNQKDIAELEDFYYLIFDKDLKRESQQPAKQLSVKIQKQQTKKIQKTKVFTPKKKLEIEEKDPELVAFYESIFGKVKDETSSKSLQSLFTHEKQTQSTSANTEITPQENPISKVINENQQEKIPNINATIVEKERIEPVQNTSNVIVSESSTETASLSIKNTLSETSTSEEKKFEEGTGVLDNNFLSSQVKNTNSNTKVINKKAETKLKASNAAPANDMTALFAKAFGGNSAISVPSNVKVDFRVNLSSLGEIEIFSNNSGPIDRVDTETLLKLLDEVLKEKVFTKIKQQLGNEKKTLFSDLYELNIPAIYNSTNLSLDLEIKPELRKPQILSLIRRKKANVREENIIEAHKVSGFLNAFTTVGLNSADDEANLNMRLEGSLNIDGVVFETSSDYRNEKFDLGNTTLTYDRTEKLQRFTLGNISTGSRNFQENIGLEGIRISKEFFLDPDLQISPRANEPLELDSDSEVELYINNRLIQRFYLKAGVYSLQDIGLYNGANNIRIRIKDEFGKVTVKTSQQYYDSHLLKPGLSLFAISVGYLNNQQTLSNNKFEKSPILSGYYQKGINEELTISVDAQLNTNNFLFGAESIRSIEMGTLQNSIAISGGKDRDIGFASSFEFRPSKKHEQISLDTLRKDLLDLNTVSRGFINNWSITGEYRSEDFSLISATDPTLSKTSQVIDGITFANRIFDNNKLKANLQTNFNLNISEKWQGTLNLGLADYYNAEDSFYGNLSATRRFDNGTSLSIGTRYDTEDKISMNLQLSIPLSRKREKKKIDLDVLTDSRDNSYKTKLRVQPTGFLGKNSIAGSLEHVENKKSQQQYLDLQYRNSHFESKLTARKTTDKVTDNTSQQFNIGFNTAIACVGISCATSYPITDSFALVTGPSNQNAPIALSNNNQRFTYSDDNDTGLPDNYSAVISSKGKKALVILDSYRIQNINIDEGTLPNGYDSEKTEFSMFPKYHEGFLLKAGGEPATTLDGMLIGDNNKALGFKGGQWIPENEGKTIAFFSNKSGRFRVASIPAGKYKLELFDFPGMDSINIDVPDTKGKIHDIGSLIIKTPN